MKDKINKIWEQDFSPVKGDSALKEFVTQFTIKGKPGFTPTDFMRTVSPQLIQLLKQNPKTKVKMTLFCAMTKIELRTGEEMSIEAAFHSQIEKNFEGSNRNELVNKMNERIGEIFFGFQGKGSNWRFGQIIRLVIHFVKFSPLRAGTFMPLPKGLANKKAIINPKNEDEKYFKCAVGRSLFPAKKNPQRIDKKLLEDLETLDWKGISFPTPLKDITTFEKNNPFLAINVFGFEGKDVFPVRPSTVQGKEVNLLWLREGEKTHFCCIKNLSCLVSQKTLSQHKIHICPRCIVPFRTEKQLDLHLESCENFEHVKIEMPKKSTLQLKNFQRQMEFPFVITADFESRQEKIASTEPNPDGSFTEKFKNTFPVHLPFILFLLSQKENQFFFEQKMMIKMWVTFLWQNLFNSSKAFKTNSNFQKT